MIVTALFINKKVDKRLDPVKVERRYQKQKALEDTKAVISEY